MITSRDGLWKGDPYKPLTVGKHSSGGRNNSGRTTCWHKGSGHKRKYRIIDFAHSMGSGPGVVERVEYDPNRSARIALVKFGEQPSDHFTWNKVKSVRGSTVTCCMTSLSCIPSGVAG